MPLSVAVLAIAAVLPEDRAPRRPSLDPAGTALLPWTAGMGVTSYVAGARLVTRYGHRLM